MLIILTGLPGTGKTTVAKALASEVGAAVLSTDKMRRRVLVELGYTQRKKKRVYDEMFRIAADLLRQGQPVVLDGTFYRESLRSRAFSLGGRFKSPVFMVEVVCSENVVKQRIEKRYREKSDFSEADYRVFKIIQSQFEPVRKKHFIIDTADGKTWRSRLADVANKIRVTEKKWLLVDKLRKTHNMRLIQTHISWVLLDGQNAYKIKKPVRFSFLDYSTLTKRRYFCRRELKINRRLAPDLYLDVIPARARGGVVALEGKGEIVEYAVKMAEMPQELRMDNLIRKDQVGEERVREIARVLADFHGRARLAAAKYGTPATIEENFSHAFRLEPLVETLFSAGAKIRSIQARVDAFLEEKEDLFRKRIKEKKILHCHGDVRTSNIFIREDKIYIFDAIEFNDEISSCDAAAEVAYLAMDLHSLRRKRLADEFIRSYVEFSRDRGLPELIDFYECYRALVRMLVASYSLADPEIGDRQKRRAKRACQKYLNLAYSFSERF
ncbi:MAG: AAA family ATPase [Acidobacteriota bacterium]